MDFVNSWKIFSQITTHKTTQQLHFLMLNLTKTSQVIPYSLHLFLRRSNVQWNNLD